MHECQPFYIVQKAMQALIVSFIREMVCSEGVNGAGEYSCCIVVNATCCAAHLPISKNLPHVIDLLAQHFYFFASNRHYKYQMKNISCYVLILHQVNKTIIIVDHDSSKLIYHQENLAAFTEIIALLL